MPDLLPTPPKDAVPEDRLYFGALPGGFGAAQEALAKFQQAVEHFLAASGFLVAPQGIAELFEGAALQLDFLGEGGEGGPHAVAVDGGIFHAGFIAGKEFRGDAARRFFRGQGGVQPGFEAAQNLVAARQDFFSRETASQASGPVNRRCGFRPSSKEASGCLGSAEASSWRVRRRGSRSES